MNTADNAAEIINDRTSIDENAFMIGWIRWCIFDDFDSCRSEDERKGWNYAARENELGGASRRNAIAFRASFQDAANALADYIRFGFR